MLKRALFLLLPLCMFVNNYAFGGNPEKRISRTDYISTWKDVAIRQMQEHKIPASITLAQAILESGDGNSLLAKEGNNHFGIKCHDWTGKKMYYDDDAKNECFRKYKSASESFKDHSIFLKRSRYAFLFDYKITDYKSWAKGLKKAGYATNPKYPELLIKLIEDNNLYQYDQIALGKIKDSPLVSNKRKNRRSSDDDVVINFTVDQQEIFVSENKIKYIIADAGKTPEAIAESLDMGPWQIRKYNDIEKNYRSSEGERIYIQPKRNKSKKHKTHVVQPGETLRDISQKYGVKMKKILKRSDLPKNTQIKEGMTLNLR